jgi:hypothetical protein
MVHRDHQVLKVILVIWDVMVEMECKEFQVELVTKVTKANQVHQVKQDRLVLRVNKVRQAPLVVMVYRDNWA